MEAELIELAMKIKISRRRTRLTTYGNMELYTTQPSRTGKKRSREIFRATMQISISTTE